MADWRDDPAVQQEMAEERLYLDVSEHLTHALEQRDVSRAGLAKLCGVGRSAITQRFRHPANLTLKVIADTLHALGYGLEVGLVDRRNGNRTTRLRNYEAEHCHDNVTYLVPAHSAKESREQPKQRVRMEMA